MIKECDFAMRKLGFDLFKGIFDMQDERKDCAFEPRETALRQIAEKRGGYLGECVSVWIDSMGIDWERARTSVSRKGFALNYVNPNNKEEVVIVKAMPVSLEYSFTIWTKSFSRVEEAIEQYLWLQYTNPNLEIMYENYYPLELDIHLTSPRDESPYKDKWEAGEFYVYSFPVKIDGWIFNKTQERTIKKIIVKTYATLGEFSIDDDPILEYEFSCPVT